MQRITPFVTSLHWRRVSSAHSRSEALACVALALALSACDRNSSEVVTEVDPRIPSADAASTAAAVGRQRVFILPWEGVVGIGARAAEIVAIGREADAFGPGQIIVLEVISPGGLVIEADRVSDALLELKTRHRVIAWIREAISAAAFASLHCNEIYFHREGTLGAITIFSGTKSIQGRELDAWVKRVGDVTQEGGRNRWIGEAMTFNAPLLSYDKDESGNITWHNTLEGKYKLSDELQNLVFNAELALDCKFSNGTADTPEELLALMRLDPRAVEVSDIGFAIHKGWQSTLQAFQAERPRLMQLVTGSENAAGAAGDDDRVAAIDKLIAWWDVCEPCMQFEDPPIPPKEVLEQIRSELASRRGAGG